MTNIIRTAEFVSPKHPDKICDFIADCILDAYLAEDKNSRVAVEVMGGHNLITINGEVTSQANPDISVLVGGIVGASYKIICNIAKQSPEIARGVDVGGAGDQGIMKGYATSETPNMMPLEYELARNLCMKVFEKYPYDGKVQVTLEGNPSTPLGAGKIKTVVVSFQNSNSRELFLFVRDLMNGNLAAGASASEAEYFINPAGEWTQGGFDADTGLSGRKLIVDNYGPEIPIGGGSFSGKDYTKVDRSGAYMARKIAVDLVKKGAKEAFVKLAYAIGKAEPVMAVAEIVYPDQSGRDGKEIQIEGYDLSPQGIREYLKLDQVKFVDTCQWGHFGRNFNWDQ